MTEVAATTPTVDYQTTVFTLLNDHLGPNKATLLHARTNQNDGAFYKAILYTHGYSDYYFQYVKSSYLQNDFPVSFLVIIYV